MRKALRVLGAVGVWAAVSIVGPAADANHAILLTACPADPTAPPSASPGPSATPSATPPPSPQNCVPESGTRLTGTMNIAFQVSGTSSRPLRSVRAYIDAQEEGVPAPRNGNPFLSASYSRSESQNFAYPRTFAFTWNTVTDTPFNGSYKLRVVTTAYTNPFGDASHSQEATRRDLLVDNAPAGLAPVRIVSTSPTTVSVEWDPAAEPDVLAYHLYRAKTDAADEAPGRDFVEVANVAATSLRDPVKDEGFYWYSVIVTRRSVVTPETGISSAASPLADPAEVKAADKPDDDDGGGGGPQATPKPFVPRVVSRLPSLSLPRTAPRAPAVPDAPFSAVLPYDVPEGVEDLPEQSEGGTDPRGPVLPVAVGAFLVSSALALGRMPY